MRLGIRLGPISLSGSTRRRRVRYRRPRPRKLSPAQRRKRTIRRQRIVVVLGAVTLGAAAIAWPWALGTAVAKATGAHPATARYTAIGWAFETPWLGALIVLVLQRRFQQTVARLWHGKVAGHTRKAWNEPLGRRRRPKRQRTWSERVPSPVPSGFNALTRWASGENADAETDDKEPSRQR